MLLTNKHWKSIFLFCFGIFIGSAFCMKWMEADFLHNDNLFTIIGLEITYSKERIVEIFSGITPAVKTILTYHLAFDFAFMTGVYPGIAALCMMAREKRANITIRKILLISALLQILAFGCDILENIYLLTWLNTHTIGTEYSFFHYIVAIKWILAVTALIVALIFIIKSKNDNE